MEHISHYYATMSSRHSYSLTREDDLRRCMSPSNEPFDQSPCSLQLYEKGVLTLLRSGARVTVLLIPSYTPAILV